MKPSIFGVLESGKNIDKKNKIPQSEEPDQNEKNFL